MLRKRAEGLTVGRARLALAVIAVVVAGDDRGVDVGLVRHSLAETVAGQRHLGYTEESFAWVASRGGMLVLGVLWAKSVVRERRREEMEFGALWEKINLESRSGENSTS